MATYDESMNVSRKWTGLDTFLFLLRTIWFVTGVAVLFRQPMEGLHDMLLPVGFFLSYFIPQLFFRPQLIRPLAYALSEIALTGGLFVYVSLLYNGDNAFQFLYLPLTVGYMIGRKGVWYAGPLVVLLIPLLSLWLGSGELFTQDIGITVNFLAYYLAFYGLGLALNLLASEERRTRELAAAIREKNEVLEQYACQVEEMTLLEERSRMARELHDTVGHTFTSVIIGMDAVRCQIDSAPEEAKENLQELLTATRQGLDEIRRSIHQMAAREQEGLVDEVAKVAAEFERSTGTEMELAIIGEESVCPQIVRLAVLRCVQEGLTNAKRHGRAPKVRIRLEFQPNRLALAVTDNGSGFVKLAPGFGLKAMQERLAALQGTVTLTSRPGEGATLLCEVPLNPAGEARAYAFANGESEREGAHGGGE
ncbi:sensor histidine kinase [Gorillibacterium timonense]|uniref:sensor histidine kinase n=1 Tax=Gorillibacterium timonense TaxID=1689269 RepID=UPI00071D7783|nr:sensor histidine kinase [Gorillibacterium timonense]